MEKPVAMPFALHPQLEKDTVFVADLTLCRVLLMNDSRFPWLILVPRCENVREIFELDAQDRQLLIEETALVSKVLDKTLNPWKINVAALGNVVPQLHMHVIARYEKDEAWPNPVWSRGVSVPYATEALAGLNLKLLTALKEIV